MWFWTIVGKLPRVPQSLNLTIHPSQFPDEKCRALAVSLRKRRIDPQLHYQTKLQSARWQRVFERWSPFAKSKDCGAIYRAGAAQTGAAVGPNVLVVALGCGDGSKDALLLRTLGGANTTVHYVPADVSVTLVTRAALSAREWIDPDHIHCLVADLARSDDLPGWFDRRSSAETVRLITFYGMIPNLEPDTIFRVLKPLLRKNDRLLFSANLMPESGGMAPPGILSQYDNLETRRWLSTLFEESGVPFDFEKIVFSMKPADAFAGGYRIAADYVWDSDMRFRFLDQDFEFEAGTNLNLFFSYRYTAGEIHGMFEQNGMEISGSWILPNQEEGVFACRMR